MAEQKGFEKFFGKVTDLVSSKGTVTDAVKSLAESEVVGFYFSAHWCPPCRGFTPQLVKKYNELRKDGKKIEMVFISSDKDQSSFEEYHKEMPWLALAYEERELKAKLSQRFKVSGIPTLILFDGNGKIINKDGRMAIMSLDFPFKPPTFAQCMGEKEDPEKSEKNSRKIRPESSQFITKNPDYQETAAKKSLAQMKKDGVKYLALYFSAHWCGPCRNFTPKLAETYKKLKAKRNDFEFIFVSSDKNDTSFQDYLSEMPWYAMPFEDRKSKENLSNMFGVRGIPHLCVIDMEGKEIRANARTAAESDPEGNNFPWVFPTLPDLADGVDNINDYPALILLQDANTPEEQKKCKDFLMPIAKKQEEEGDNRKFLCYTANNGDNDILKKIRELTKVQGADQQKLLILDIPDKGGFYVCDLPKSTKDIRQTIKAYRAKELERKQLS